MTVELYEETFEMQSSARLVVKNIRGSVKVVPGEAGAIKVKAEKVLASGNAEDLKVEIYQDGNTVYARALYPERLKIFWTSLPCKVHFEIEAPPDANLDIKTVSAAVEVNGFTNAVRIRSVSGHQTVNDLAGLLDLESVSGGIVGRNLKGKAVASTVSGRLRLSECSFDKLRAKTVSCKLEIETGLEAGPYDLSSVSGSVKLVAPKDANCDVLASGVSGRFFTDLNVRSSEIGNRTWRVKIGTGGAEVRMKTVSGRMSLVSSFDAKGSQPKVRRMSREDRSTVLTRLSQGELTVEAALRELA
jgi:hypothetical protein